MKQRVTNIILHFDGSNIILFDCNTPLVRVYILWDEEYYFKGKGYPKRNNYRVEL